MVCGAMKDMKEGPDQCLRNRAEEMQQEGGWAGSWAAGRACAKLGRLQADSKAGARGTWRVTGEVGKSPGRTNPGARLSYPLQIIGKSPKHVT